MNNKIKIALAVFAVNIFVVVSCNGEKHEDAKSEAETHNEAKFENKNSEKDAQFLVDAAEINLEEIKLGHLAYIKGEKEGLRDLGKMMETSHQKCFDELKTLAQKKSITVPLEISEKGQEDYNTFSNKPSVDFDKDYCDKMIDGHKAAISKFEKASVDCTDPEIKEWALKTLPELRTHLDHAISCKERCKKHS